MAVTNQTLIDTSFKTVIKTVSDNAANSAVSIFKQKYPSAEDIYVIQDIFKKNN